MNKDYSRIAAGGLVILLGLFWLLRSLDIIPPGIFHYVAPYWPVGVILIGLAIIYRVGWAGWIIAVLTAFLAIYSAADSVNLPGGPERNLHLAIAEQPGIETVDLKVAYGAGRLEIGKGDTDFLDASIRTRDAKDPKLGSETRGTHIEIGMDRNWMGWSESDEWDLGLSDKPVYTIDLDYGAAEAKIDLRDLKVKSLRIDSGASNNEIIFGAYPTKVEVSTGASALLLRIPKDMGAIVKVSQGLSGVDLEDFIKSGNTYYSPAYDSSKENIEIDIDAGVSGIEGRLY